MKLYSLINTLLIVPLMTFSVFAGAQSHFDTSLLEIQHDWAKVNYTLNDSDQIKGFENLLKNAKAFVEDYPDRAEPLVWYGIIESSYAGAKGGIGALSNAKEAKKALEKALKIDELVLEGSAYTSLGILYHKVPGWPISFGDDDDARLLLEKAISVNPTGIDSNYFYGEFLFDEREYDKAKVHLTRALNAPPRPTRKLADESRRAEINALMLKLDEKLSKKKT
ncbi:hypothetical protein DRW07_11070 [Alteromonas sediminis]|uniref:Uncharacterized protein n=1 Tax=Alteromonas sediminis TaxID=2259342 RepID=A0A3N5YBW3_9ALTE|nr:hypothetical protein [Alteromonas sediminis]RPJ66615.1 hypothetical protein DRW07_11070 [Alteromonas sediminis]